MKQKNLVHLLISILIIIGGVLLRLAPLFASSFSTPFHLGGLFYEFSRQIILNHFHLPETIPYYSPGGIPFLYPPLVFYLQSVIIKLFNPPIFLTVNLLPVLFSILTLPAFYWMIISQVEDQSLRISALFVYAFMPSAFINQIEAAGLAEACGTIFILLFLGSLFRHEKNPRLAVAIVAGISLGLSVLSSPGSAYGAVFIGILFLIKDLYQGLKNRSARKLLFLAGVGIIGLMVASPWLVTILRRGDFANLAGTFLNEQRALSFANQIRYMVTFKPADMITFIGDEGVFGFVFDWLIFGGLIWAFLNKAWMQVALFFGLWVIPREGCWLVAIPSALLAAWGGLNLVWSTIKRAFSKRIKGERIPLIPSILVLILLLFSLSGGYFSVNTLMSQPGMMITSTSINSLLRARTLIPAEAHVLVAGNTALREWAPALLEREVLNCEFGSEWKPATQEQVFQLNDALANRDLGEVAKVITNYTGDASVWLVAEPDIFESIISIAGISIQVTNISQLNDLVIGLFVIES